MKNFRGHILLKSVAAIAFAAVGAAAWQRGLPPQPEKPHLPEEQYLIQSLDGKVLFHSYCATCHGIDGTGGGPTASALKSPVPDLTRINERNAGRFPIERVKQIISGENTDAAAHGSREMPVWGPIFHQIAWDQDLGNVRIHNLAKFIESLQRKF